VTSDETPLPHDSSAFDCRERSLWRRSKPDSLVDCIVPSAVTRRSWSGIGRRQTAAATTAQNRCISGGTLVIQVPGGTWQTPNHPYFRIEISLRRNFLASPCVSESGCVHGRKPQLRARISSAGDNDETPLLHSSTFDCQVQLVVSGGVVLSAVPKL
jgi:hypothetical protein